jgi:hypothetical protein
MRTNVNWDMVHRPTSLAPFSIQTNLDRRPISAEQPIIKIQTHLGNHEMARNNQRPEQIILDAPNCAPLAVTTSMRTNVNWDMVHRPTSLAPFSITTDY